MEASTTSPVKSSFWVGGKVGAGVRVGLGVRVGVGRSVGVGVAVGLGVGVGVLVGVGLTDAPGDGVLVGVAVGVGVGVEVGVGEAVGLGVGVGLTVRFNPVAVKLNMDWSLDTICPVEVSKFTKEVTFLVVVFALNATFAIWKAPDGGLAIFAGSSPTTIEILPVVLASDIDVTLIFLVNLFAMLTSCVILMTLGSNESSVSANATGESELTQTPKVFSGGTCQAAS